MKTLELPTSGRTRDRRPVRPVWGEDGPRAAITDRDGVKVWNLATASEVVAIEGGGPGAASTLTPDGHTLVTASPDGVHAHSLPRRFE
jgi:hypothetical protein